MKDADVEFYHRVRRRIEHEDSGQVLVTCANPSALNRSNPDGPGPEPHVSA